MFTIAWQGIFISSWTRWTGRSSGSFPLSGSAASFSAPAQPRRSRPLRFPSRSLRSPPDCGILGVTVMPRFSLAEVPTGATQLPRLGQSKLLMPASGFEKIVAPS